MNMLVEGEGSLCTISLCVWKPIKNWLSLNFVKRINFMSLASVVPKKFGGEVLELLTKNNLVCLSGLYSRDLHSHPCSVLLKILYSQSELNPFLVKWKFQNMIFSAQTKGLGQPFEEPWKSPSNFQLAVCARLC